MKILELVSAYCKVCREAVTTVYISLEKYDRPAGASPKVESSDVLARIFERSWPSVAIHLIRCKTIHGCLSVISLMAVVALLRKDNGDSPPAKPTPLAVAGNPCDPHCIDERASIEHTTSKLPALIEIPVNDYSFRLISGARFLRRLLDDPLRGAARVARVLMNIASFEGRPSVSNGGTSMLLNQSVGRLNSSRVAYS